MSQSNKASKLAQLSAARKAGRKLFNDYSVDEDIAIYDEVDDHEYRKDVQKKLLEDDFVVNDEDGQYTFKGEYEWDNQPGDHSDDYEDDEPRHAGRKRAKKHQEPAEKPVKSHDSIDRLFKKAAVASNSVRSTNVDDDDEINSLINGIGVDMEPEPVVIKKEARNTSLLTNRRFRPTPIKQEPLKYTSLPPPSSPPSVDADGMDDIYDPLPVDEEVKTEIVDHDIGSVAAVDSDDDMQFTAVKAKRVNAAEPRVNLVSKKTIDIPQSAAPTKPADTNVELPPEVMTNLNLTTETTTHSPSYGHKVSVSDLVVSEEGDLKFFWTDYQEVKSSVILFGKVYNKSSGQFASCFIQVKNIYREVYFLPRQFRADENGIEDPETPVMFHDVYSEVDELLFNQCGLKETRIKQSTRKYCFEIKGIPREADYLKVLIPYDCRPLPQGLTGSTFSHVFGANTNIFEQLVLSRRIMGPCWLNIKKPNFEELQNSSWCDLEVSVSSPLNISVCEDPGLTTPPVTVMSLSLRTVMNHTDNSQEIVACSLRFYQNIAHDSTIDAQKLPSTTLTLVRPIERVFPPGFENELDKLQGANGSKRKTIRHFKTETALLQNLVSHINRFDPDIILGHQLENVHLNVLAHRLKSKKISSWSQIGRMKRGEWPYQSNNTGGNNGFYLRNVASGRLLCDVANTLGKSMTVKCDSWSLTEMCQLYLGQSRHDQGIDIGNASWLKTASGFCQMLIHNEQDTHFMAAIAFRIQILALSKQLTNLAGNSWAKTLTGTRAERNEYILLHEFVRQKYIVPDKWSTTGKNNSGQGSYRIDEEQEELKADSSKKKDKYKGGLVFEPEKGLYDKIVLVMDFNSLYPSIIQEFNICFTTVDRSNTIVDASGEEQPPEAPERSVEMGILPRLIQNLVERRREVKRNMKDPRASGEQKAQWDIKQQALKLTANSMYGCLGFTKSRFYARPLAVLTTFKGREILTNTKELAEGESLKVVYGDTDSVMINTNVDSYEEAVKIGNKFKKLVNDSYRLLEIDIDNVFKRLLLHAKKKYAALVMSEKPDGSIDTEIEVKGLDMKRREFCTLSKDASSYALEQILKGEHAEIALENIHEYLRDLADKVRKNEIPLSKFIIRNKLGKNPKDYPNIKNIVHAVVAQRRIDNGEIVRIDDVILYVITAEDKISEEGHNGYDDTNGQSVADRAYTPQEIKRSNGKLRPDANYYLSKQILPSVERLCAPIQGTDMMRLAECLGLDLRKYAKAHLTRGDDDELDFQPLHTKISDEERFRACHGMQISCGCGNQFEFKGLFNSEKDIKATGEGIVCSGCNKVVSTMRINAQLEIQMRREIALYYEGWLNCSHCGVQTRQICVYGRKCLGFEGTTKPCSGIMHYKYNDLQLYNQLLYFDRIFDVDRVKKTRSADLEAQGISEQNRVQFEITRSVVSKYLANCGRRYVDMASIFGFMSVNRG